MSTRENRAAAAEFRELAGVDFDEFTRRAPIKLLLAISRYAAPTDAAVLQFADETHPLFQQQRRAARLADRRGRVPATDCRSGEALPGLSAYMLGKAMHALGDCDCYFKPADFFDLFGAKRKWFQLLIEVGCAGGDIARHQVHVMLVERSRWLRN